MTILKRLLLGLALPAFMALPAPALVYGPDKSGTYGGAQGIGGLDAVVVESTGGAYASINNTFGDAVGVSYGGNSFGTWGSSLGGYGELPGSSVNHSLQTQWRGHYEDLTGFYYMGARYYEPQSGRFLSADPLGHAASMSLYDYCDGDPVNHLDPDGRMSAPGASNFESDGGSNSIADMGNQMALDQLHEQMQPGLADASFDDWVGAASGLAGGYDQLLGGSGNPVNDLGSYVDNTVQTGYESWTVATSSQTTWGQKAAGGAVFAANLVSVGLNFVPGEGEENAAIDAAAEAEGVEVHHLFPQQFRQQFEDAGIDIDAESSQTILPKSLHTGAPDGVHAGPAADSWNGQWKQFFQQNSNPSPQQIYDQLAKMRAAAGI